MDAIFADDIGTGLYQKFEGDQMDRDYKVILGMQKSF